MKIIITNQIHNAGLKKLNQNNVSFDFLGTNQSIFDVASNYDGVISMLSDKIDSNFLHKNNHLKVISNYAVGFNNIDVEEASKLGIKIGNTPDVLTDATADLTIALILATTRNLRAALNNVTSGHWKSWEPLGFLGMGLKGKTLGIIGMGRIGSAVAKRASLGFEMNVIYTHPSNKKSKNNYHIVSFEELLLQSDIISLHCPLTDQTNNLFDRDNINKMKTGSYFINTARGAMHDELALCNALNSNKIRGVGLDVTTVEPIDPTSKLLNHPNSFILPHIGSATDEARKAMSLICAENIIQGLNGLSFASCLN